MKYPKVGEKFYWKDENGEISESTCLKINKEIGIEPMYFISLTKNGGGAFVNKSEILNPDSYEIKEFKKELAEKKVKEVIDYLNQEEVRRILMAKLINEYDWLEANKILDILSN